MYCKSCGHRWVERKDVCPKCGVKQTSELEWTAPAKKKVRWQVLVLAALAGVALFAIVPRFVLQSEFEVIGPTDKVKLLQALGRSPYRRNGQRGFRIDREELFVVWDLRWNTLETKKQEEIVRAIGHAWEVVVGGPTRFEIDGLDGVVAEYRKGTTTVGAPSH